MYRELPPPPDLRDLVRCTWSGRGTSKTIIPDGCLDLIVGDDRVFVAGPDTAPWLSVAATDKALHGIRFHPGNAPRALGCTADELRDQRVPLVDLWGRRGRSASDRLLTDPACLAALVRETVHGPPDPLVERLLGRLRNGVPRVATALRDVEVGERQLRRRFTAAVGYGPATYLRVARLQRAIAGASSTPDLAALAHRSGYADQAHLSREFRALTGATARKFLIARSQPPGDRSVQATEPARH